MVLVLYTTIQYCNYISFVVHWGQYRTNFGSVQFQFKNRLRGSGQSHFELASVLYRTHESRQASSTYYSLQLCTSTSVSLWRFKSFEIHVICCLQYLALQVSMHWWKGKEGGKKNGKRFLILVLSVNFSAGWQKKCTYATNGHEALLGLDASNHYQQ